MTRCLKSNYWHISNSKIPITRTIPYLACMWLTLGVLIYQESLLTT